MKSPLGTLYVVATPIGNLEDITLRALRIFKEVDFVLAEDTRQTGKLLMHYEIKASLRRFDSYLKDSDVVWVLRMLTEGKNLALATDAGTPSISDPGSMLVRKVREHFGDAIAVVPIPGASALTAALSVAGITDAQFTFYGFPPQKKGRQTFFTTLANDSGTSIFFESPHRIMKALATLAELSPARIGAIGRELTKLHEEVKRGTLYELFEYYSNNSDKVRGEFVVIIGPSRMLRPEDIIE